MIFRSFLYGPSSLQWELFSHQPIKPGFSSNNTIPSNPLITKLRDKLREIEEAGSLKVPIQFGYTRLGTVNVEEYRADFDSYREKAILRAATSILKIGKNEDGSIWVDTSNLHDSASAVERMRATGGDKNIYWNAIKINLHFHSFSGQNSLDQVGLVIDYYASEYAQYKTRIERQFSGEEQTEALAKLEELFSTSIQKAAEYFVLYAGEWFEHSGRTAEREAIYQSFLDIYEQRKADYLAFIAENPDYAQVLGTKDEWLFYSGDFMGEMLRFAFISSQQEKTYTSRYGYSLDELTAMGFIAKETWDMWSYAHHTLRSEEELGVVLGIAAMKLHLISEQFQIRHEVKTKLEEAFYGFVEKEINKVQAELEWLRNDPFVRNKNAYAVDVNRQLVLDIIQRFVNLLTADDLETSFRNETLDIITSYRKKMLDKATSHLALYHPYHSHWVSWLNQQFTDNWNRFIRHLSIAVDKNLDAYRFHTQFQWVDTSI